MEHYAGIDVSLEFSSVCIVDAKGKIVRETKVASEPEALVAILHGLGLAIERVGLEAGPLSQWLHAGLTQAGFETVLLETRHVKAALSAMTVKTDRKDARGIAQLLRMGWFRPVHCKSPGSQEVRASRANNCSMKTGMVTRKNFDARVRELCVGQAMLEQIAGAMLVARAAGGQLDVPSQKPAIAILLWLGVTNLVLGIFNLLPGLPLDGGRVLRAVLWKLTGKGAYSTVLAAWAGRVFPRVASGARCLASPVRG